MEQLNGQFALFMKGTQVGLDINQLTELYAYSPQTIFSDLNNLIDKKVL